MSEGPDIKESFLPVDLPPFVKWPGGKAGELKKIRLALPESRPARFLEPFLGGGAILLSLDASIPAMANDICPELINLFYGGAEDENSLKSELMLLGQAWDEFHSVKNRLVEISKDLMAGSISDAGAASHVEQASSSKLDNLPDLRAEFLVRLRADVPKKLERIRKLQIQHNRNLPLNEFVANLEGSLRSTFYMAVRTRYNRARVAGMFDAKRNADFFFLREYSYASMFRFNSKSEFNVPYGGISYNKKSFISKVDYLFSEKMRKRLTNTQFSTVDFEDFFKMAEPTSSDFVFVDPPYDTDFSDYDGRSFVGGDQIRLAAVLESLRSRVMVVIGDTPFIRELYPESKWNVQSDDMLYKWTIKERNQRDTKHLTITNYEPAVSGSDFAFSSRRLAASR